MDDRMTLVARTLRHAWFVVLCALATGVSGQAGAPSVSSVADAAQRGDEAAVRALIDQGANVRTAHSDGMTALHWAAFHSHVEIADALVDAGANVDAVTRIGRHTPVHVASANGHAEMVRVLVEAGCDPTARTSTGTTPLHLAARAGSAEAVATLLDRGADVNALESKWGQTPLMFAASSNRADAVAILIERGADLALSTKVVDLPAAEALDRTAGRRRGEVLRGFRAAAPADEREGWQPTARQVQAAITAAREVQASPEAARTAGAVAERSRGPEQGFAERVGTQGGLTALLHAARQGHGDVGLALLDAGADIEQASGDGTSPLQIATMNGHFDLALRLLDRGADPNNATDAGATPLFAALNLQWAPRARYPQPRAHDQQQATYLEVMQALLEAGADPNVRLSKHLWYTSFNHCCSENVDGATPFWRAAYATDVAAMQLLVSFGADVEVPTRVSDANPPASGGETQSDPSGLPPVGAGGPAVWPIHAAAGVGYGEGFESNAHRHVPDGWMPSMRYLVEELGLDVNIRDHNGYNVVHHAASRGDSEMVRYLVDHGADVMAVSRRGETTADMSNGPYQRTQPFPETLALLESLGARNNHNCVSC